MHSPSSVLSDIEFLDDDTRPEAPRLEGLTLEQRAPGRHLRMIHNHFRENMQVLRGLIDAAAQGAITPEELRERASDLHFIENSRRFGNLCGQHCQIIEMHHGIEDQAIFPVLSQKAEAFRKVTQRLVDEHVVVHALLERLIESLVALIRHQGPEEFAAAREVYDALEKVLLSHFGYEEESIGDALGYYEIGV
ncbi:hemerythrin domain-containing protein [Cucumibacter marinus]|uniref:hemerythrin domain-containing protein n=1 Tax=Cucumibacter marinus TaxID=1121252 RepID=UPI00041BB5BD|nr:hemerythrin domain-containing protein [Cucumibacter marinus]